MFAAEQAAELFAELEAIFRVGDELLSETTAVVLFRGVRLAKECSVEDREDKESSLLLLLLELLELE